MARFNIALLPVDEALHEVFANLAQSLFATVADEYILGPQALAHVTLCHFEAPTEAAALDAFASLQEKRELLLTLCMLEMRAGEGNDAGRTWIHFPIEKTPDLLAQQKACFEHLTDSGLKAFNPPSTYFPHLTLSRIRGMPPQVLEEAPPIKGPIHVQHALGLSTPVGVYVRAL